MATQPSTAVATLPETAEAVRFGLMQRQARMFALSPLVPEHLRKGGEAQALANCYIAMTIADRMGEDRVTVMQNIHIVSGKAGFSAQYMIARANASGVFKGRINWRIDRSQPQNLSVTAFAALADTGEEVKFTVDMAMAQAEGWTKNPKYKSIPELMLRYRSATFLVRLYAPDVMLGYQTAEEVEDVAAAILPCAEPLTATMLIEQSQPAPTLAEEPGDKIPAFDQETGKITEAAATDARELDAGETPDAPELQESEEAPADADEPEPDAKAQRLDLTRKGIKAAKNASYLKAIEDEWLKHAVAYDDGVAVEMDGLFAARRRELRGEGD